MGRFHKSFLGVNLLTLFGKLGHFINGNNIFFLADTIKTILQKEEVNLLRKSFMRLTPGCSTQVKFAMSEKKISSPLALRKNKLERLFLAKLFRLIIICM